MYIKNQIDQTKKELQDELKNDTIINEEQKQ